MNWPALPNLPISGQILVNDTIQRLCGADPISLEITSSTSGQPLVEGRCRTDHSHPSWTIVVLAADTRFKIFHLCFVFFRLQTTTFHPFKISYGVSTYSNTQSTISR
jgi:hypothetical protein